MNPRQLELIKFVQEHGSSSIEAIAEKFNVTLQTVRRDVTLLAQEGLLTRFHGGVRAPNATTQNIAYQQRRAMQAEGKARIARTIAQRVPNGCSLFLNIGTTIEAVAQELHNHRDLRVVTNNLNIATTLSMHPHIEVTIAGGVVRSNDQGVIGEATVEFIRQFKVDIGLIGISGIESDGTLRDFDYREVKVARTIIGHSREIWLAADHSKLGRPAMVELGPIADIDVFYTDLPLKAPFNSLFDDAGTLCVVAET